MKFYFLYNRVVLNDMILQKKTLWNHFKLWGSINVDNKNFTSSGDKILSLVS